MNIEELKKQFFVDDDALRARLEALVMKAKKHCGIDKEGHVIINDPKLPSRDKVKLVLAARAIAAQLDSKINAEVRVSEIGKYTGLPDDQVRARGKDAINGKFAESRGPGVYRALPYKIEPFLDSLGSA